MSNPDNCKPMRKKYWSELIDSERIVKLQDELIRTQRKLSDICHYVERIMEHDHLNGRLVTRVRNPNEESCGGFYFRIEEF